MFAANFRSHSRVGGNLQLLRMPAELMHGIPVGLQNLGCQKPQLPIAQHGDRAPARYPHLIQNLASCGKRFGEHRRLGGNRIRYHVQIAFRQSQKFAKSPGMAHNAEHGTIRTVAAQTAPAPGTVAACEIDFADHALADQVARIRGHHFAYKFMPGHAGKSVIAALQFEIGVANAAEQEPDQSETLRPVRLRVFADRNLPGIQVDCNHSVYCILAGRQGFEPRYADPESAVLPLDDLPSRNTKAWRGRAINHSTTCAPRLRSRALRRTAFGMFQAIQRVPAPNPPPGKVRALRSARSRLPPYKTPSKDAESDACAWDRDKSESQRSRGIPGSAFQSRGAPRAAALPRTTRSFPVVGADPDAPPPES